MRKRQKIKAVELMCQLELSEEIINDFFNNDKIYIFEEYGGYPAEENEEVVSKIKEQQEQCSIVYAVTHEIAPFGELYDLLVVPKYEEDWEYLMRKTHILPNKTIMTVLAYVWNKTDEVRSEPGHIAVECSWNNLRRLI